MGRLFWKILIGCLLTYTVCSFGVLPAFSLLRHAPSLTDQEIADRLAPMALEVCRQAIIRAGPDACRADTRLLLAPPDVGRLAISERPAGFRIGATPITTVALSPGGRLFVIGYHMPSSPNWPLPVPLEVLLLGLIGSLAFSAVLVTYVVAPVRKIRSGFLQLTNGNLSARVADCVGGRRDEIADLARNFDVMASHLEQLVTARDRLLHDVSHELRSPLSRLHLAIALARQDREKLINSLSRIEREANRLDQIVGDLLVLARAESGIGRTEEYFDFPALIQDIVSDASFEADARGVLVTATQLAGIPANIAPLRGNPELLRRAIENVLRNAIRYSPPACRVSVQYRFEQRYLIISIDDEGPGLDKTIGDDAFTPFITSSDEPMHVGLGLAIAHRAVSAYGGKIVANNKSEKGLNVTLSIERDYYAS